MADEWVTLCAAALTPSSVAHKPLIYYRGRRKVTGRATEKVEDEELNRKEEAERMERQGDETDITADKNKI